MLTDIISGFQTLSDTVRDIQTVTVTGNTVRHHQRLSDNDRLCRATLSDTRHLFQAHRHHREAGAQAGCASPLLQAGAVSASGAQVTARAGERNVDQKGERALHWDDSLMTSWPLWVFRTSIGG